MLRLIVMFTHESEPKNISSQKFINISIDFATTSQNMNLKRNGESISSVYSEKMFSLQLARFEPYQQSSIS